MKGSFWKVDQLLANVGSDKTRYETIQDPLRDLKNQFNTLSLKVRVRWVAPSQWVLASRKYMAVSYRGGCKTPAHIFYFGLSFSNGFLRC